MEQIQVRDIDCEMSVIGVLITYNDAFYECADVLKKEVFWKPEHQELFVIVKALHDKGDKVDIISVNAYAMQHPNNNYPLEVSYMTECTNRAITAVNFREHCLRLHDLYERRQLWLIGQKLISAGISEINDTDSVKQDVIAAIQSVEDTSQASIIGVSDAIRQLNSIVAANIAGENDNGIPTGFSYLDVRGGLQPNDLVVIAAEFSQGKTSLALDLSMSAARNGYPVAFYSTEMTNQQLAARMVSANSGLSYRDIMQKHLTGEQLSEFDKAVGRIESLPIFFDDTSTMSIERIISSIRMLVRKKNIRLACIDYLQVLQTNEKSMRQTEEQFYGAVTRKLKNLAKELGITMVLLSQISRSRESRETIEPSLSRVRGSGQISEAADVILLIYRPEHYNVKYSGEYSSVDPKGTALIKLAKGRNIGTGGFICGYDAHITHFYELTSIPRIDRNCKMPGEFNENRPF